MFAVSSGQTLLLLYNAITHILATQSSCIIFYLNMCYAIYLEHLFPPQEELGQRTAKEMHSNYRSWLKENYPIFPSFPLKKKKRKIISQNHSHALPQVMQLWKKKIRCTLLDWVFPLCFFSLKLYLLTTSLMNPIKAVDWFLLHCYHSCFRSPAIALLKEISKYHLSKHIFRSEFACSVILSRDLPKINLQYVHVIQSSETIIKSEIASKL